MNKDQKAETLRLRAQRYSIYEIAEALSVSPQVVHPFLKGLPVEVDSKERLTPPKMDETMMNAIFVFYVEGHTIDEIAKALDIDEQEIVDLFKFLKSKFNKKIQSPYYPKVAEWITDRNMTLKEFAADIDVPVTALSGVLAGQLGYYMTAELAKTISDYTGLSLLDIFQVQIEQDPSFLGITQLKEMQEEREEHAL